MNCGRCDFPAAPRRRDRRLAPHPELDRTRLAERRGVGKRGEIGRAIGDMNAIEQAVAMQLADLGAEQRLRRGRDEQHRAVAAVPGDDVGHVARQQAVTVLLGVEQPEARSRQRFSAERQTRGIERRRDDAERGQRADFSRVGRRQHGLRAEETSRPAATSAKVEASATTRRDADSAASSGTTTSQIAAKEAMPPVSAATAVTSPVSASEDSMCALSYRPVRDR